MLSSQALSQLPATETWLPTLPPWKTFQTCWISFRAVVDIHSSLSPALTNFKNIQHELTSTHDLMWWVYQGLQQPEPGAKGNTTSRPWGEQARFTPVREWLHGSTEAPCLTGECASPLNSWNSYCYFISFIFLNVPPHSRKKNCSSY